MTREEEITNAADDAYPTWEEQNTGFIQGARWADSHPRKGLVDIEKACEYLREEFVDMWLRYIRGHSMDDEIKMFKNYMQNESEN